PARAGPRRTAHLQKPARGHARGLALLAEREPRPVTAARRYPRRTAELHGKRFLVDLLLSVPARVAGLGRSRAQSDGVWLIRPRVRARVPWEGGRAASR